MVVVSVGEGEGRSPLPLGCRSLFLLGAAVLPSKKFHDYHYQKWIFCWESFVEDRVGLPVVLGGFVSRLGYPRPPVFDGAGVPLVLTRTHQRDAPSKQDDGDIRAPTLCGWCCHGRHVVMS